MSIGELAGGSEIDPAGRSAKRSRNEGERHVHIDQFDGDAPVMIVMLIYQLAHGRMRWLLMSWDCAASAMRYPFSCGIDVRTAGRIPLHRFGLAR